MIRYRIRVTGRVQGVGFRWFTVQAAQSLHVVGWVANMPDGTVLCEAQAEDAVLDQFLAKLRDGPRWGRVDELHSEELDLRKESSFEIR